PAPLAATQKLPAPDFTKKNNASSKQNDVIELDLEPKKPSPLASSMQVYAPKTPEATQKQPASAVSYDLVDLVPVDPKKINFPEAKKDAGAKGDKNVSPPSPSPAATMLIDPMDSELNALIGASTPSNVGALSASMP